MKSHLTFFLLLILTGCIDPAMGIMSEPEIDHDPVFVCPDVQPYRESWCVFLTNYRDFESSITQDSAWAFVGIEASQIGYHFNNHTLELWASDTQDNELPAPLVYVKIGSTPVQYSNGPPPYIVLVENEFHRQWQNVYGPVDSSMTGKYVYVRMRLVNECGNAGPWLYVAIEINKIPGNTNCPHC